MLFDELRSQIESASSLTARQRPVRAFVHSHESPLIEDTVATFFHVSPDATEIAIEGDWTNWRASAPMTRFPDTFLWYRVEQFPLNARLEYRLLVNGHRQLDPYNAHIAPSAFGPHSELLMPEYHSPAEVTDESRVPFGKLQTHWISSHTLGDRHAFWVYLPPGYSRKMRYPVVFMNDGSDYIRYADFPRLADHMIAHGICVPFVAVLIKPNQRTVEYARNAGYAKFLADELVPWVDSSYPTAEDPSKRAIVGASFGGLAAAHAALKVPGVFGLVAGQSGFYSFQNDTLLKEYASAGRHKIRFHLIVGQYETDLGGEDSSEMNFVGAQQRFAKVLQTKGYELECAEYPEGHQWYFWRAHLSEAFQYFWGTLSKTRPARH